MISKKLEIKNKLGLHARAASVFVKTAGAFSSEITVTNPENEANGKSIMAVMMLQAAQGSEIEITVNGDDELAALSAIENIVLQRFGEDE